MIIKNQSLVSIVILTFNRPEDLKDTLRNIYAQKYKDIEVIVVDNASTDNTYSKIKEEFQKIIYIKADENVGIAGYNLGFKQARGEFILLLDDDSYPEDNTIERSVHHMMSNPDVGILALRIYSTRYNQYENSPDPNHNEIDFIGCGAFIRKNDLDKNGYFDPNYFLYHNEMDLAIRFRNSGSKIHFLDDAIVFHKQSNISRKDNSKNLYTSELRYYHNFIGRGVFIIKYISLPHLIISFIRLIINRFIIALRYGYTLSFIKASAKILMRLPKLLEIRIPINDEVQRIYNYGKMHYIDKTFFPKNSK